MKTSNNQSPVKVSVGIAAYNAEKNIAALLLAILSQKQEKFVLEQIMVYSDCSTDGTVSSTKSVDSGLVKVIQGRVRRGFAGSLAYLLSHSSSELTIILNDDILIDDKLFVQKIVEEYQNSPNAGLICANPQPIKLHNFIASAIASSFYAYYKMGLSMYDGHNMYTYDGKVMAVTEKFRQSLKFPKDLNLMGNVDSYIYFSCISLGYTYRFVKDAVVWYLNPTTIKDYLRWYIRNNANQPIMQKQFGVLVDKEYRKPRIVFIYYLFLEFIKNPLGAVFLFVMSFYIRFAARSYAKNFTQTWEVVTSTKNLLKI